MFSVAKQVKAAHGKLCVIDEYAAGGARYPGPSGAAFFKTPRQAGCSLSRRNRCSSVFYDFRSFGQERAVIKNPCYRFRKRWPCSAGKTLLAFSPGRAPASSQSPSQNRKSPR